MARMFSLRVLGALASFVPFRVSLTGSANSNQKPFAFPNSNEVIAHLAFDSSSPHIFSSLRYLLKQWPNTFFPNGHSIVPCEVPPFVQLYHGRQDGLLPASPEWLAFDNEMAYGIMGSTQESRMLTYQTTKPVKCLYFDGLSAGLLNMGQLHSQMLFLYGNVTGPPGVDEYYRAVDLCRWIIDNGLGGSGWGIEGIVRMSAGFEMIWCNFSSPSVRLIDDVNVAAPLLRTRSASETDDSTLRKHLLHQITPTPTASNHGLSPTTWRESATAPAFPSIWPDPERVREREPYYDYQAWEWFRSAARQYGQLGGDEGESRVRLYTCGFMTFYDPVFRGAESMNANIKGMTSNLASASTAGVPESFDSLSLRRRWQNLTSFIGNDSEIMRAKARRILQDFVHDRNATPEWRCTGPNWHLVADKVAQRFSKPLLDLMRQTSLLALPNRGRDASFMSSLRSFRALMHSVLLPFFEYPQTMFSRVLPAAGHDVTWSLDSELARSTFSRCKRHHAQFITVDARSGAKLSAEENIMINSLDDVMSAICGTLIPIFFSIERTWLAHLNVPTLEMKELPNELRNYLTLEAKAWSHRLRSLHAWLGWEPDRIGCNRQCEWDEVCYIPIWPLRLSRNNNSHYIVHDPSVQDQFEEELLNPQCINIDGRVGAGSIAI